MIGGYWLESRAPLFCRYSWWLSQVYNMKISLRVGFGGDGNELEEPFFITSVLIIVWGFVYHQMGWLCPSR
jgi:hypothetical protein